MESFLLVLAGAIAGLVAQLFLHHQRRRDERHERLIQAYADFFAAAYEFDVRSFVPDITTLRIKGMAVELREPDEKLRRLVRRVLGYELADDPKAPRHPGVEAEAYVQDTVRELAEEVRLASVAIDSASSGNS